MTLLERGNNKWHSRPRQGFQLGLPGLLLVLPALAAAPLMAFEALFHPAV